MLFLEVVEQAERLDGVGDLCEHVPISIVDEQEAVHVAYVSAPAMPKQGSGETHIE